MNVDIKPCPFCGSAHRNLMGYDYHKVSCSNEFCSAYDTAFTKERWNTRHIPEGYVLVPIEPTDKQIAVGWSRQHPIAIYKAMIAAAQDETE